VVLPTPANITLIWNFGSILGLCLLVQFATGLFLAIHYSSDVSLAFQSVRHTIRDVNFGWLLRIIHSNRARLFFVCVYLHIARGLYYGLHSQTHVWIRGATILLLLMATAFLGYVLPWGQISFWGATVITNLFSAIPYMGPDIVFWLWGGFSISQPTLGRFFTLHFLLPFILLGMAGVHLLFLHQKGSRNSLGLDRNFDKLPFHSYFSWKDVLGFMGLGYALFYVCTIKPWYLRDPENFISANPLVTPLHIQPEWYFLFAYAILRSIPSKLGGVVALVASVLVLYIFPFLKFQSFKSATFNFAFKKFMWALSRTLILLTWIGARPVEDPYVLIGQTLTIVYFISFIVWVLHKSS
jgi:ubiquinol-cytochrome c reductase cytochrome b subunit